MDELQHPLSHSQMRLGLLFVSYYIILYKYGEVLKNNGKSRFFFNHLLFFFIYNRPLVVLIAIFLKRQILIPILLQLIKELFIRQLIYSLILINPSVGETFICVEVLLFGKRKRASKSTILTFLNHFHLPSANVITIPPTEVLTISAVLNKWFIFVIIIHYRTIIIVNYIIWIFATF